MNIGQLFVLFGLKVNNSSFQSGLKQLAALKAASSAISGVIHGIGEQLVDMALEAAKSGTHILGTASALGMSTRSIQEWSYVAKQAGSDVNQFTVGISMFERNLREFGRGRGSKRFIDAMHEIGMSRSEARAALTGPDGINPAIFKVADAYQRMGNTANRAAINTGLFGARARGMAQDLSKGSAALRAQIVHLNDIGGVVGEDKLKNLKRFQNSLDDVKTSFNALVMQVVGGLGPGFSKMLDKVTAWIGENRELISDILTTAFKVVAFAFQIIGTAVKVFADVIRGALNGDVGAVALLSLMAALVVTVAIVIASVLIPTIVAMGVALWVAMLPILPYTLILAAIIALVYLLYKHWDQVKAAVRGAADAIWGILKQSGQGFKMLGQIIWDELVMVWDKVKHAAAVTFEAILNGINWVIKGLNKLPHVNIGYVDMPEWVKHNTAAGETNKAPEKPADQWRIPKAAPGRPATWQDLNMAQPNKPEHTSGSRHSMSAYDKAREARAGSKTVNVAPITINITGVKDAADASKKIGDSLDQQLRHASGALGGD